MSAEPLLKAVDLTPWFGPISWVIAGCQSEPEHQRRPKRPTDPAWVRALREQCQAAGVPFWLKQLAIDGKARELPELDGRSWTERPAAG